MITTTYNSIEHLIENKVLRNFETAKTVIFEAYYHDRIDGLEYEELITKAEKKFK